MIGRGDDVVGVIKFGRIAPLRTRSTVTPYDANAFFVPAACCPGRRLLQDRCLAHR